MACTPDHSRALGDLAAGTLPEAETIALLVHLDDCPDCSDEMEVVAALATAAEDRPHAFLAEPRPWWRRPEFLVLPAAAAAAIVISFALSGPERETGTPSDVSTLASAPPLPATAPLLRAGPGGTQSDAYQNREYWDQWRRESDRCTVFVVMRLH